MLCRTSIVLAATIVTLSAMAYASDLNPQPMPPGAHAGSGSGQATNYNCWPHKHVRAGNSGGQANTGNSQSQPCTTQQNQHGNKPNTNTVQSPRD